MDLQRLVPEQKSEDSIQKDKSTFITPTTGNAESKPGAI